MMIWRGLARGTRRALEALDRPMRRGRGGAVEERPRGVALILVLVTIAILSTAVVEFSYQTLVHQSIAANENDRLKSYFMARSAVNLSSLLLAFQFALADESKETEDDMGRLISRAMRRSNFQIHQYLDLLMKPFNSGKIESPIGGIDLRESGVEGFAELVGRFEVEVEPESGRMDVNQFYAQQLRTEAITPLCAMVLDPQFDELFEQEDALGEPLTRQVVLQHLVDYVDPNEEAVVLSPECVVQGRGGDEGRQYARDDSHDVEPRNARLTHVEELYQVHGVTDAFMRAFGENFTVYNVGKPNINTATAPVFYSLLCQNVELDGGPSGARGLALCAADPTVAMQVMWFALALDGLRQFFSDPLTVLMAYLGSTESKLLPSAKKGQPVAFLSTGQLHRFLEDFKANPVLMAQFLTYSPAYQQLVLRNPAMAIDPLQPAFPTWGIKFDRSSLVRSVTAQTPTIYRIEARGIYGSSETVIEAVIDIGKTVRRLPDEKQLEDQESDPEAVKELKERLKAARQGMPKGRFLYWREE